MQQNQKIINLLTICIKAGRAVKGFDMVAEAVKSAKAFCVIAACDASERTMKEVSFICDKYSVPLIRILSSKEELAVFTGKNTAVIAVCDKGFSDKFIEIAEESSDIA
ncbi:MAG: 50S ribosomal protein L7 [Ruminococcus sp.]|nr:50S ribosomal protein L7 [Ruminococcus sp.]